MPPTVIVTDGDERAALAVVRSLGAAGYRCVVTSSSRQSIAGGSRFVARAVRVPSALQMPGQFTEAIVDLAAAEKAVVVLPIAEQSLLTLLPVRAQLFPAIIPFSDIDTFRALTDKEQLLREAARLGIAIPSQEIVRHPDDIGLSDLYRLDYPIVLKPARSVGESGRARVKLSVSYAANAVELRRRLRTLPTSAFPVLLQQRVIGPGTGIFLLLWNGEVKAQFAHERLCEKPPSGGESVYRRSIAMDADLRDKSRALLERFEWQGVAMVEYKRDCVTGQPYLMEVNGRFWGSLQLAIDSGVDFPRILVTLALGALPQHERMPSYRVGVRSRWWWGQVDHLICRVRQSQATHLPPPNVPTFGRAFTDLVLGPLRRADYEEILRWTDPGPFWNESIRWIARR